MRTGEYIIAAILNELEFGYGIEELESYGRPTCQEIAAKIPEFNIAADLLALAEQYLCDVETRIEAIKQDRDENEATWHDAEVYDEYQDQINHWIAIKNKIVGIIDKAKKE